MKAKAILLLILSVSMSLQQHISAQTFTPAVEDSINFVIIPALVLIAPDGTLLALDKDLYTPQQLAAKLAEVMGEH